MSSDIKKESQKNMIARVRATFAIRWPDVFNADDPVPLALTIRNDLMVAIPEFTEKQVKAVLVKWCHRPNYLLAHVAGAARHGLDGIKGEVTEQQAIWAAEYLQTIKDQAEAKKKRKLEVAEKIKQAEAKKAKTAEETKLTKEGSPSAPQKAAKSKTTKKTAKQNKTEKVAAKPQVVAKSPPKAPIIVVKKKRRIVRPTE